MLTITLFLLSRDMVCMVALYRVHLAKLDLCFSHSPSLYGSG